uniref:Putative guanine nucleotide exchange factor n=1 Tax=Ixodes ricinus TaxID=34613 RepID=A0A090XAL4_IXORI
MGQVLKKVKEDAEGNEDGHTEGFPDLASWPPELSLAVLSHLNATDLCLASCVWAQLAQDEVLWHSLCVSQWGYASIYAMPKEPGFSYRRLYLQLDEGTVTFNADAELGMQYFISQRLVRDVPLEIARFLHHTQLLNSRQMRLYLQSRRQVLDHLIELQNFENQLLPQALRRFFRSLQAPNTPERIPEGAAGEVFLALLQVQPPPGASAQTWCTSSCFSLIMLSVDLRQSTYQGTKCPSGSSSATLRQAVHRADDVALRST